MTNAFHDELRRPRRRAEATSAPQLGPSTEAVTPRDGHLRNAHHFRDLAAHATAHPGSAGPEACFSLLDAEADSLRRAMNWCVRHDPDSALAMVGSLWPWWHRHGHYGEGRAAATAALNSAVDAPARLRAPALSAAGLLALLQCDYEAAQSLVQQGLDAYSSVNDLAGLRWSLALLGEVALQRGEYTVAGQLHEQALVLARRAEDVRGMGEQLNALARVAWLRGDVSQAQSRARRALEALSGLEDQQGIVCALVNLGVTARYRADLAGATALLTDSLLRSEHLDYREGVAWSLNQLGVVSRLQGDHDTARAEQDRSLQEHRRLGGRWRTASVLDELAALSMARGDADRATAELTAADRLRREIGAPMPMAEEPARRQTLRATQSLGSSSMPTLNVPRLAGSYR
ncbi:MAG TPA: tetratricopeptide repeat protein [Propionibacteriaceae bacterium]